MAHSILIIGAGVIGASTALALAERGCRVTVLDKHAQPACGASKANGGQLSYSYTDAFASPSFLRKMPQYLLGLDPAFRVKISLDPDFLRWGLSFLRNCNHQQSNHNTLRTLELALESQKALETWVDHYGLEFHQHKTGKLFVFRQNDDLLAQQERVLLKRVMGIQQSLIGQEELYALEPSLKQARDNFAGAIHAPDDQVGSANAFTTQALDILQRQYHGQLLLNTEVVGIRIENRKVKAIQSTKGMLEADLIIFATGPETTAFSKMIGWRIPIIPVRGYSFTLPLSPHSPQLSITDMDRKILLCRLAGDIRVAGLGDIGRFSDNQQTRRINLLKDLLASNYPGAADYTGDFHPWTGERPMTPDNQPLICKGPLDNLYFNCGHGMLGWTLAAGSAQRLAHLIEQG